MFNFQVEREWDKAPKTAFKGDDPTQNRLMAAITPTSLTVYPRGCKDKAQPPQKHNTDANIHFDLSWKAHLWNKYLPVTVREPVKNVLANMGLRTGGVPPPPP